MEAARGGNDGGKNGNADFGAVLTKPEPGKAPHLNRFTASTEPQHLAELRLQDAPPNGFTSPWARHLLIKDTVAFDAAALKGVTNRQFVDVINRDSKTPVGTEWLVFSGTAAGKAGVKGYLAQKLGAAAGESAARLGMAVGLATGVAAGTFTAYELSKIWSNKQRIDAYHERLLQPYDYTSPDAIKLGPPEIAGILDKPQPSGFGVTDVVEKGLLPAFGFLSKYTTTPVVDYAREKLGLPQPETLSVAELSRQQAGLSDARYMQWAEKTSNYTKLGQGAHDLAFGVGGYLGAMYMASHLIPHASEFALAARLGAPLIRMLGAGVGVLMSRIKTTADEREMEADLLEQRLLQRAEQHN